VSTPFTISDNAEDNAAVPGAVPDKLAIDIIARRALAVLASTPLETGEYIAHSLWGRELAKKLLDPAERANLYLLDVRDRDAFDEGHIEGAHHVPYTEWASKDNLSRLPLNRKIIVICDSGHQAAQVVAGLRLLGFDAALPRTGITGWARTAKTVNLVKKLQSAGYPVKRIPPQNYFLPAPAGAVFDRPDATEFDIIAARAYEVFAAEAIGGDGGCHTINARDLHEQLNDERSHEDLFLLDLRREEDFEGVGHIEGSMRMDFDAAALPQNLERLPRDKKIVTICYTGNLASQLATVLRLLGFDASALAYGMASWTRTPSTYLYLKDIREADNPLV